MTRVSRSFSIGLRTQGLRTAVLACFAVVAVATTVNAAAGPPRFFNYVAPPGSGDDAGEPSIGINWTTEQTFSNSAGSIPNGGTVNYFGGFMPYMLKVTFNDCSSPAHAQWDQKPLLSANTPRVFGDPILYTDKATGRTLVSQLEGLTPAGSTTDFTDDDGGTFLPTEGSGLPACVDHQTLGGGPFHAPLTSPLYPNAVYYCSQCVADATCSLSLDGGITFLPGTVAFTLADCVGLHGHIKVGPDGTAYIPNKGCGGNLPFHDNGKQAVIVTEDNGVTWDIREIPTSTSNGLDQNWDPSVALATDGSVYFGYRAADGRARVAVSHDKGLTWSNDSDVGADLGIVTIAFPEMVAGDGGVTTGRAAFAYYGTTTPGDDTAPEFPGIWHLYISSTFDGGQTWSTVNATPNDPIQRGGICHDGTCRNMLDFMDASIDKEGRVLVGWDDGCIGGCVDGPPNSFTAKASITRQSGGKRMFAAFDPAEPHVPQAPSLTAIQTDALVQLSWQAPDHGGAPITSYKLYRSTDAGPFTLIATPGVNDYEDNVNLTSSYTYRLTAVNAQGEGPYCGQVSPATVSETPCAKPGIKVISDLNPNLSDADSGQNTPPDGSVNVRQLYIAEPYLGVGVSKLVFRMNVAPSLFSSPPPNSQWFIIWNRLAPDSNFDRRYVAMRTNLTGATTFEYGNFGVPLDPTNPNPNANTPVMLGAADAGSYDLTNGIIEIELATSKAENIQPGQSLVGVNVRNYFNRPDPGQRSQNNASDITGDSSYDLVGNASCFCTVNEAPLAVLTAAPTEGEAPLTVNFDASGSSDPNGADGDAVGLYTFNFGDGSDPVTQASPFISHTYTTASGPSGFFATLTVKDMKCGRQSLNVASEHINVTQPTAVEQVTLEKFAIKPLANPSSHGQAFFALSLDRHGPVQIQAYNAAGRRVADIVKDSMLPGRHTLHWRGLDESGRRVPAGVYMVKATCAGRSVTTRVVLVH